MVVPDKGHVSDHVPFAILWLQNARKRDENQNDQIGRYGFAHGFTGTQLFSAILYLHPSYIREK
jgi:hypothetical protein